MKSWKNKMEKLLSLPRSFFFCLRCLPFEQAIKIPFLLRYNCKVLKNRAKIYLPSELRFAMIKIGFGDIGIFDKRYERSIIEWNGNITFRGDAYFGQGSRICVGKEGRLTVGDHFTNTAMGTIVCFDKIQIGDDVLTSWNTLIIDTDFHETLNLETGVPNQYHKPIFIHDRAWIGTRSVVLKGSEIPSGCIVGASSTVNRIFENENTLIAGSPARECKCCITRKLDFL